MLFYELANCVQEPGPTAVQQGQRNTGGDLPQEVSSCVLSSSCEHLHDQQLCLEQQLCESAHDQQLRLEQQLCASARSTALS